jgi:ribosomal protein S12 methylthiotransferase accessory factor YcaO
MSKVVPLGATWNAIAALTSALEETAQSDKVMIVVQKEDGERCKYMANITNAEVHWQASLLCDDVMNGRFKNDS